MKRNSGTLVQTHNSTNLCGLLAAYITPHHLLPKGQMKPESYFLHLVWDHEKKILREG